MSFKVLFNEFSSNKKLGYGVASSYMERRTCPDTCQLKGNECYAEGYPVKIHWDNLSNGIDKPGHYEFDDFLSKLKSLPKGKLFRNSVAGDLPGENNKINIKMLNGLVDACRRLTGFGYTHKPVGWGDVGESPAMQELRSSNTEAVRFANENGFTINLSADSLQQADYLKSLEIGPVVSVVSMDHPRHSKTAEGNHVIVCPNEMDKAITCDKCLLCTKASRKAIVAFRAHGVRKHKLSKRLKEKVYLQTL